MSPLPSDAPAREYERRRAAHAARAELAERASRRTSNLRVLAFLALLAALAAVLARALHPAWLLAPLAAFVALVVRHDHVDRARARAAAAVDLYARGLARLRGDPPGPGAPHGQGLAPPDHPYAADLDLFGPGSLFERLAADLTPQGERALAGWLLAPAAVPELRQRHVALRELHDRLDLREDLARLAGEAAQGLDPARLRAWGDAPPPRLRALAAALGLLSALALALLALTDHGPLPLLVMLGLGAIVGHQTAPIVERAAGRAADPLRGLTALARLLRRLDREPLTAPALVERQRLLAGAAAAIAALARRVDWLAARESPLFLPVDLLGLWSLHWALAIDRWRRVHGPQISAWLAAFGEIEALLALARRAYEAPADPLPELVEGPAPVLVADDLRHPLLPGCVPNSLALGAPLRVLMVSGSNMSGKSTLLRALGVNVVLALAGAPVSAARLRLSPLAVGATLRVEDSLQGHASRFYAELARLRRLMDLARAADPPLLFLLDEIFHGTNSHDRRIGAEALLRALVDAGAIGLCTTHDLALAEAITDLGERAANVHFEDHLDGGRLAFDYRMRPGVVRRSNALALMRALGLLPAEGAAPGAPRAPLERPAD